MQQIDTATTRRHLRFPALIDALRAMFVAGCEVPLRTTHRIGEAGTLLVMPAWRAGGLLGIKTVTVFPGNSRSDASPHRCLPGLHSTYLLFDAETGLPLAQIDGDEITSRRTAAASALAASYLARPDSRILVIVGAGRVAAVLAEAMRTVRPIERVIVWNHRPAAAEALAASLRGQGFEALATPDLARAAAQADIVSCATLSTAPIVHGAWLAPNTHLDLIGSFTPSMREADAACFAASRVFVDTPEALAKSGDLLGAIEAGTFSAERLQGTLAELCAGTRAGRLEARERTVFKSVGTALEDLAAAECVWHAVQRESLSSAAPSTLPHPP